MKRQLLEEILAITKEQKEALVQEDIQAFEALMAKKQIQIDAIEALHLEHPETREQKEELLLAEIIKLDEANRIEFMRQYNEVKEKLSELRQQKRADSIYGNPYDLSREEGMFIDKR